jgi:hypothetical protein
MQKITCTGLLLLSLLFSCKNENLNIGGYLVDSGVQIIMTDTLTVRLYNIAIDSVLTSNNRNNTGIAFAGYYDDPEIGTLSAQSYIEFSKTTNNENNKYADFDSVMLVILPNGNYYGDTTKYASFKISKIEKEIEMGDDGYMYSTSAVPVGDMLTEAVFRMEPGRKSEEVEIRLPDDFGEMLFRGMVGNEPPYMDNDHYLKTFPGLSVSTGSESACVYGFGVNDTSCLLRIYYHISATAKEEKTMEFKANTYKMFHRLMAEKLPDLGFTSKDDPVPSRQTRNMGILMSGTPLYTRIEIPHLNNFLSLAEIVMIREATLIIRPVHNSYDVVPLPPVLNLFYHDPTSNDQGSALTERSVSGGTPTLTGNLPKDYQQRLAPYYSFNITDFISSQLGKQGYSKWDLSVAIPKSDEATSIQRLLFGNQQFEYNGNFPDSDNQVQLRVVYVTYND